MSITSEKLRFVRFFADRIVYLPRKTYFPVASTISVPSGTLTLSPTALL